MKIKSNIHLFLLPVVFFLCIPALFVKQNIQDIARLDFEVIVVLISLAFVSVFLLLSANALFGKNQLKVLLGSFSEFVCFFVIATGFMFPTSISTGMMDPENVPVNLTNLLLALPLASAMLWVARGKHRQIFYFGLLLFIALNTALSGYTIYSKLSSQNKPQGRPNEQSLYKVSNKRNIFVLSFDGIAGSAAREVLSENASLSAAFHGFILFSKVSASSPATSASTAASLYGNKNFKLLYQTDDELWDSQPDDLITNHLNSNKYKVSTFGSYNRNFTERDHKHHTERLSGISVSELINFTIARTFTSIYVLPTELLDQLEREMRSLFTRSQIIEDSLLWKITQSKAPKWKKDLTATYLDTKKYINELEVSTEESVAHFLHFTFSHYPVEFDRNCTYMGHKAQWYEDHQNRFGVKEETYCALTLFSDFISKIKKMSIFEQSMIILKSDHGKTPQYYEPGEIEALTINGHPRWGYGRYAPFLAVKGFGNANFSLRENSSPVLLDDLALTVCTAALGVRMCTKYPGFNLLDETISIPATATATIFVVRSENSTHKYDTHMAVTVHRQPDILQNIYTKLLKEGN